MIAERQIVREARRAFKRLSAPGAYIENLATHLTPGRGWGLFVKRNDFSKPVGIIDCETVSAFRQRDWLSMTGEGRAVLSDAGDQWYRRQVAGDDPFRKQHQSLMVRGIEEPDGTTSTVTVNTSESPLTWLRSRRDSQGNPLLSAAQFEAGERLRRDFERSQIRPHVTANWDAEVKTPRRSGGGAGRTEQVSDAALAAKRRFQVALDTVGPELASVLLETCCYLNGLSAAERRLGWPRRSGKLVLNIALNTLARHYGYLNAERSCRPAATHWGADGYRPSM